MKDDEGEWRKKNEEVESEGGRGRGRKGKDIKRESLIVREGMR